MTDHEPFPATSRSDSRAVARRGRSTRWWVGIVCLALSPLFAVAGVFVHLWLSGTPLIDEWQCADGEAPVLFADGGSWCQDEGSELPEGGRWDPLGNRPLVCHDRWGWIEVEAFEPNPDRRDTDCVPDDRPIPEGYRRVS